MSGILMCIVLVLALACLYQQIKQNINELRASELEDKLARQKAENKMLKAKLNNIEVKLNVKTIGY